MQSANECDEELLGYSFGRLLVDMLEQGFRSGSFGPGWLGWFGYRGKLDKRLFEHHNLVMRGERHTLCDAHSGIELDATRVERLETIILELRDLARESDSEESQNSLAISAKSVESVLLREHREQRQMCDADAGIELDAQCGVCNWLPSQPLRS